MAQSRVFLSGPFKVDVRRALPPAEERRQEGRAVRERLPRARLGVWKAPEGRADPVETVSATAARRQKQLIPLRNARMAASAFTFYRGTAELMARDLATQPHTGLYVQLCGDAHLSNFGLYASRERVLVFDINDFDETGQGPWEWDVKRLATSFVLAARENGISKLAEDAVRRAVLSYVVTLEHAAGEGWLERRFHVVRAEPESGQRVWDERTNASIDAVVAKAKGRTQGWTVGKFTEVADGQLRLRLDPPVMTAVTQRVRNAVIAALNRYIGSLPVERRADLFGYHVIGVAHKVVGIGSVGTYDYVVLLEGDGPGDHLLLQVKESGPSAVKAALGDEHLLEHGERVVVGSWVMQAVSDPFLGWTSIGDRSFFVRQLKDMKGSVPTTQLTGPTLGAYAVICGHTLARAHARVGDPQRLLGYIGKGRALADAMWAFSSAYADQAERDYAAFKSAVDEGRLPVDAPALAAIRAGTAASAPPKPGGKAKKAGSGVAKKTVGDPGKTGKASVRRETEKIIANTGVRAPAKAQARDGPLPGR